MIPEKFQEAVDNILIPIINHMVEIIKKPIGYDIGEKVKEIIEKETLCRDYISSTEEFQEDFMAGGKEKSVIDRHKEAALFYINFVNTIKKNYKTDGNDDLLIDLFAHNAAFNAAIAIIESFICADTGNNSLEYISLVKAKGLVDRIDRYRDYTIKEFIFAHRENKLSVFLLANIFYCIELNFRAKHSMTESKAESE